MIKIVENVILNVKELARVQMLMIVTNVFMLKMENIVWLNALTLNIQKMEFVLTVMKLAMDVKVPEILFPMMGAYNVIMPSFILTQRFKNALKRMQHVQVEMKLIKLSTIYKY